MKLLLRIMAAAALLIALPAFAQSTSTLYARSFPGTTVGAKVAAAQNACTAGQTCIIVIGPALASYPEGTMPAKCAQCVWEDLRTESAYVPRAGGTMTGPLAIGAASSAPALSITADGTFDNITNNRAVAVGVGGYSFGAGTAGDAYQTAIDGAIAVPSSAVNHQSSALTGQVECGSSTPYCVGLFTSVSAASNNAKMWGSNPGASDTSNGTTYTGSVLRGTEIDVNALSSTSTGSDIFIEGNLSGNPSNLGSIDVPQPIAGHWSYGLFFENGSLTNNATALNLGAYNATTSASYRIAATSYNAGTQYTGSLYLNAEGYWQLSGTNGFALNSGGFISKFGTFASGLPGGFILLPNAVALYSSTAANNLNEPLIELDSSNHVSLSPNGLTTVVGGQLDLASGHQYEIGGSPLASTDLSDSASLVHFVGSLTTTANSSDRLSNSSVPAGAACSVTARNSAAAGLTGVYVPLVVTAGSVVVDHSARAGGVFSVFCQY